MGFVTIDLGNGRTADIYFRKTDSGSIDVVVKGEDAQGKNRRARVMRFLSRRNKAAKIGTFTWGRKGSSLRALGFQTVGGRLAQASK